MPSVLQLQGICAHTGMDTGGAQVALVSVQRVPALEKCSLEGRSGQAAGAAQSPGQTVEAQEWPGLSSTQAELRPFLAKPGKFLGGGDLGVPWPHSH